MKPLIVLWSWIKYLYPLTWLCWWRRGYLVWHQCILMITSSTIHLHRLMIVLSLNINIFLSVYNYQFCMVCTVHNLKLNKTRLNVGKKKITLLIRSVFLLYICWWKIATEMQLPVFKSIGTNSVLQTNLFFSGVLLYLCNQEEACVIHLGYDCDSVTYCRISLIWKLVSQRSWYFHSCGK